MNPPAYRATPNPATRLGGLGVPAAIAARIVAGPAVTAIAPEY
ncbi:MAG: hypothetical protein RIC51_09260 [Erythrobacter sp.]